ncbi:MAG: hypothetical protein KKC30_12755 [Proteobacteria bacterium]|nr:hypothetical protein [Pseudomonadota bacterium]MBU4384577.1 hypothetical protein [Pseudomonadota bacterium]MBU4606433.1 hypothetical protein [Pseudomonadota bacterium]MCG2766275.1 hypothetical protein [Desulfarculaceae bacterium]
MPQRLQIFMVLGLVTLLAACMGPAVDPGPDPARVVVSVERTLTGRQVREAMSQGGPFPGSRVRLDNFLGPFWELSVQQKQPDGSWRRLPTAPDQPSLPDGYKFDVRRVFLAPPGAQELRLRLAAYINRSWEEQVGDPYVYRRTKDGEVYRDYQPNWRSQSATIYISDLQRIRKVDLKPGQELVLEPFK